MRARAHTHTHSEAEGTRRQWKRGDFPLHPSLNRNSQHDSSQHVPETKERHRRDLGEEQRNWPAAASRGAGSRGAGLRQRPGAPAGLSQAQRTALTAAVRAGRRPPAGLPAQDVGRAHLMPEATASQASFGDRKQNVLLGQRGSEPRTETETVCPYSQPGCPEPAHPPTFPGIPAPS